MQARFRQFTRSVSHQLLEIVMSLLEKIWAALFGGSSQIKGLRVAAETRKADKEKKAARRK